MKRSKTVFRTVVGARADGATLRQAAAAAGVHVATVCRWQRRRPRRGAAAPRGARGGGAPGGGGLRVGGGAPAPGPGAGGRMASGVRGVGGGGRGPDGLGVRVPVLGVRALAAVPVGELAAPP